jgi:Cytochrome P460
MISRLAKLAIPAILCAVSFALSIHPAWAADRHRQARAKTATADVQPTYTPDGRLMFPAKYREWIFLTSGLDMSYNPAATAAANSVFDNVFVNPAAYRLFMTTGTWPDKTMLVLENRGGEGNRSINRRGKTQMTDVTGFEVHVKDALRFKDGWAFYSFDDMVSAKKIERPASCYTCHEAHGGVDTTFVQFYPTLMPIAKQKGTLRPESLKGTSGSIGQ